MPTDTITIWHPLDGPPHHLGEFKRRNGARRRVPASLDLLTTLGWTLGTFRLLQRPGLRPEPDPGESMTDLKPSTEGGARDPNAATESRPASGRTTPMRPAQARASTRPTTAIEPANSAAQTAAVPLPAIQLG